ncbi:hypothetical protein CMQ_6438 [Grosmannia clavigera kw1407]|uniref:Heterokaryon incompatibility domain-containing protein n=1 Tax=Grosmannia clavigera (strain kw1407 / UAMH 11150) TaxID=655863 RepID=F0XLD9_GROCL|nr:uncharacterized protein CMQ_6438 [Grosmannia clavigera kw1407]EFX01496.1 hypothetical protein CMQ_6438 [Grosmannia clavigera kw1407]
MRKPDSKNKYIAISHVWKFGHAVETVWNDMEEKEQLAIDIDGPDENSLDSKMISWSGLVQMAHAAANMPGKKRARYIWLDLLCLDQVSQKEDKEKEYQICIMGHIYTYAYAVVTMIGGVAAVQHVNEPTGWMDRAWTLQESILNQTTYVYIKWPSDKLTVKALDSQDKRRKFQFHHVKTARGELGFWTERKDGPATFLGGLYGLAFPKPKKIKFIGVWRSMYMRTSSKPADVVYSVMAIFKVKIDPYRKNRAPQFLFEDLARKTAADRNIGPVWLTLGGIYGSEIWQQPDSGLIPRFPHGQKAGQKSDNEMPKVVHKGRVQWAGHWMDNSPWYVKEYKMQFLTHSQPHLIQATMLRLRGVSKPRNSDLRKRGNKTVTRNVGNINIGGIRGECTYLGRLDKYNNTTQAIYVGDIGKMPDYGEETIDFRGQQYLLFVRYDCKQHSWTILADGAFKATSRKWKTSPGDRYIFTMGRGPQAFYRWPVKDLGARPPPDNSVPVWRTATVHYNIQDMYKRTRMFSNTLENGKNMTVVSYGCTRSPTSANNTMSTVEEGCIKVPFSYDGWSKTVSSRFSIHGVWGLLIPHSKTKIGTPQYEYRIWFGISGMYVQIRNNPSTPSKYWTMHAVPYHHHEWKCPKKAVK